MDMVIFMGFCIFYLFMMAVTVWIGGKINRKSTYDSGDMVAAFCFIWPITLLCVFFTYIFRLSQNSRPSKWETRR